MAVTGVSRVVVDLTDLTSSDREQNERRISGGEANSWISGGGLALGLDAMWQDIRPLTDGGNESLDVSPTPVSGSQGAITFLRMKLIFIWAPATNTTNLTLTGTLLYSAAGTLRTLKPGGMFLLSDPSAAGITVTGGSTDTIIVTNSAGAAANYGVILGGSIT